MILQKTYRAKHPDFLSKEECQQYIQMSEDIGYEEALIQTRGNGQVMNKEVRDNYRVIIDDEKMATELWDKIKRVSPSLFIEDNQIWKAIGLNERFRFYRYEYGQQFKKHGDGAFKRNDNEISMITVLIYLNDDFNGGETQFFYPHDVVVPETGMLYLFKHRQLHQGNPVTTGRKYVLRTDVMFKKI